MNRRGEAKCYKVPMVGGGYSSPKSINQLWELGKQIMFSNRTRWMTVLVAAATLLAGSSAWAQKAPEPTDADKQADLVTEIGLAAQLTAYGRGELNEVTGLKDFKSPEALVAAGGILLRLHKATAGELQASKAQVTDGDGKAVAAEGAPVSLADEAEALFDEARSLAGKDKSALEGLIKQAHAVTSRGAIGGPKVISRTVKSGKTHNLHINFEANSRAVVTMRGTGGTQFEVVGPAGKVLWHSQGSWGVYTWHTGGGGGSGVRDITVRVINNKGPAVSYSVTTN